MLGTYLILFTLALLALGEIFVYFGICFHSQFQEPILLALSRVNSASILWMRILRFAIFVFWVYTSISIFCSSRIFHGPINWTDGVALNLLILQASLMGNAQFLVFFSSRCWKMNPFWMYCSIVNLDWQLLEFIWSTWYWIVFFDNCFSFIEPLYGFFCF